MAKRTTKKSKVSLKGTGHFTGMRGVYLVAAELAGRGFIASPTSRGAMAADLLVTDRKCRHSYTVQVKANATFGQSWLIGKRAGTIRSDTLLYAFVFIPKTTPPVYFIVPSSDVARVAKKSRSTMPWVTRKFLNKYKDNWQEFGRP